MYISATRFGDIRDINVSLLESGFINITLGDACIGMKSDDAAELCRQIAVAMQQREETA